MDSETKKVLIIEDDVFLGDVLIEKFNKEGLQAEVVHDGAQGLKRMKETKPSLVLLDIILPTMNGYEILEAKQKDSEISKIPVIIISNSGQPVEINRALELGVKDYFIKAQFDPEEVMVKVRNFLKKNGISNPADESVNMNADGGGKEALKGKKIMWVEDDNFLSDIISRKLSTEDCKFIYAKDSETAISLLESELPDIIVLDVLLPGMDGFDLLKKLKSEDKTKNIPVVMLSNLSQEGDIKKGKELGAVAFLTKATLDLDEVIDQIGEALKEAESK